MRPLHLHQRRPGATFASLIRPARGGASPAQERENLPKINGRALTGNTPHHRPKTAFKPVIYGDEPLVSG